MRINMLLLGKNIETVIQGIPAMDLHKFLVIKIADYGRHVKILRKYPQNDRALSAFQNPRKVQFMNWDQIGRKHFIFVNSELTGPTKVNHAYLFSSLYNFTNSIKLGAGTIINQIACAQRILSPAVIRKDHREEIKSVRKSSFF